MRYEDETFPYNFPYSIGICLDTLIIKTIGEEWGLSEKGVPVKVPTRKNSVVK